MKHRKPSIILALGTLFISGLFVFTAVGASAATVFFQGFETNTTGWYDNGGTITRASSPSTWPSSYGGNLAAATGSGYARLGIDPTPDTCTYGGGTANIYNAPYTDFGGVKSTFPTGGFTTGVDIYLDVPYAQNHLDTRFDWESSISDTSGGYLRGFDFNVGTDANGFVVTGGNNATRCSSDPYSTDAGHAPKVSIVDSGWYTFQHTFSNQSGVLVVTMQLIQKSSGTLEGTWTLSNPTDTIGGGGPVGGNAYGWFVQNEFDGLAIDNSHLDRALSADVRVTKTDSPDPAHIGQKLTYTMPVVNSGPDAATGVVLTDTLPKTAGFYSVSATQGTCTRTKTTVTCNLGSLASGDTDTVILVVKPTVKGTITNTVNVAATSPDPNTANNTASTTTTVKP